MREYKSDKLLHASIVLLLIDFGVSQSRVFTITAVPPSGSNQVQAVPATSTVEVLAGVTYSSTSITASTAFFGTTKTDSSAKLVDYSLQTCDSSTSPLLGTPFDGSTNPTQISQLSTKWGSSKYLSGGEFSLCMRVATAYSVIPIRISVRGVVGTSHKIFCQFSNTVACTAAVPGFSLGPQADARIGLVAFAGGTCGTSALTSPFSSLGSTITSVADTEEIHNFGIKGSTAAFTSYKACYCPRYQAAAQASGDVCSEATTNFVQSIGSLIFVSLATLDPLTSLAATVYPKVKFDLQILCGTGGCSTTAAAKMKIVDSASFNNRPYYDSAAGCRASLQSLQYVSPLNCDATSTGCSLTRSDALGGDGRKVQFSGIRIDGGMKNGVRVSSGFDVCFCDSDCLVQSSWFLVGSFQVQPLTVSFTVGGAVVANPTVEEMGSIRIQGATNGALRTSGTQSREMKLISDIDQAVTASDCASAAQSDTPISGHECYSLTNCQIPTVSTKSTISYGSDQLKFRSAGWHAVCFCNSECREAANWLIVSRILISGPVADQEWTATENLPFVLKMSGFGLTSNNRVKFVPVGESCATAAQPAHVVGPVGTATVRSGTNIVSITDGFEVIIGGSGTVVVFGATHGFETGDRVSISGVQTGDINTEAMLNREHPVVVLDETRIRIEVSFGPGEFPVIGSLSAVTWTQSGTAKFEDIVVLEAGTYSVCWAPQSDFVMPAGIVVVEKPSWTIGSISFLAASGPTSAIIAFRAGRSELYAVPVTWVKLVFTQPLLLSPRDLSQALWSAGAHATTRADANLATCTAILVEFRTNEGPVQPNACFLNTDSTSGTDKLELHVFFSTGSAIQPTEAYTISMFASYTSMNDLEVLERGPAEVWVMGSSAQQVVEVFLLEPERQ